ncbi:hypothetical protein HYH03_001222 [Edaphochlamys debaryana]|uniref:Patatin n=1 Tax=Edaphochlamys debaryana TaxID=47281 RepID=A0A835YPF5_9CHLO|nr:hypothetical protein HYH03_001222 [Edaphochlamys debaryana]|eukprot:KAG2501439.1 hypothetical protein HYH03_001222 [Edaphochlamys debaryana]
MAQKQRWPVVMSRTDLEDKNKHLHISRTPTLLSLDGGGMRGVITAQVLKQLEDSLKQVLWKERLLQKAAVDRLLQDALERGVISAEQKQQLSAEYSVKAPAELNPAGAINVTADSTANGNGNGAGPAPAEDKYVKLWRDYRVRQSHILSEPANWATVKKCFDVDIADFFDQLAGTSTGGLLALYLAAKGGKLEENTLKAGKKLKSRPGSASGASDFYMDNGIRIFDTNEDEKVKRFLGSGGKFQHTADGLDAVLTEAFGDLTLNDLEACGTNVLVTTVDVAHKRTASFFHMSGKPAPAYTGPVTADSKGGSGLATPLRKGDMYKLVLARDPHRLGAPMLHGAEAEAAAEQARRSLATGWLSPMVNYGDQAVPGGQEHATEGTLGTNRRDMHFIAATGGWVAPMNYELYNFSLVDVARATSAAPAYLPPKVIKPVLPRGQPVPGAWDYRVFVDGGLANNDPAYMGLAQMLQRNNVAGLMDCAILSIGTGTKASYDGYNPPNPATKRTWGQWFTGGLLGAANWVSRGKLTGVENIPGTIAHVGELVGLAMDLNGEDKENIMKVTLYGLLRMTEGTYMRIQIKDEKDEYKKAAEAADPSAGASATKRALEASDGDAVDLSDETKQAWKDALGKMDDPRPEVLEAYKEMGEALAERFAVRLNWWVRCFVFGLEDASRWPYVLELKDLQGKEALGGKFLERAITTGQATV